jgi:hypothetical protein
MSDELKPCPKCGGTHRRATIGDRVRLVDVWCPDCKQLTDYGPIEGVLTELDALRAENATLTAQWQSVPWEALRTALDVADVETEQMWQLLNANPDTPSPMLDEYRGTFDACTNALDWFDAHAPRQGTGGAE